MRVIKAPDQSPRANSYAERFVGTLRREWLDHVRRELFDRLQIVNERHLRQVLTEVPGAPQHRPAFSRGAQPVA